MVYGLKEKKSQILRIFSTSINPLKLWPKICLSHSKINYRYNVYYLPYQYETTIIQRP